MARQRASRRQAVALRYRPAQERAPKVAAKGEGYVADRIVELARANGVPVREDRNLVQVLSLLDLDQEIPPAVYRAVAEILAWVYHLTHRTV